MTILPTSNPAWGFWNEVSRDADKATGEVKRNRHAFEE